MDNGWQPTRWIHEDYNFKIDLWQSPSNQTRYIARLGRFDLHPTKGLVYRPSKKDITTQWIIEHSFSSLENATSAITKECN